MKVGRALELVIGTAERRAHPVQGPVPDYARNDAAGSAKSLTVATRLLVVEDDYLLATEVESVLRDAGYDVGEIASSAEDALNAAASGPFTLVLMDIRLATRMDGIDCAIELFKRYALRCIFATAHYDVETRRRAEPAQPLGWLYKPYTTSSLVTAVRAALDRLGKRH